VWIYGQVLKTKLIVHRMMIYITVSWMLDVCECDRTKEDNRLCSRIITIITTL
jgi:hypothetical protein